MQQVQKVMPIVFACMYMVIPVAMALYMIVSTTIRIVTQHVLFRHVAGSPPPPARAGPIGSEGG